MKKKILALVCAGVMVMGMSITAFAAPSPNSGSTAGSTSGSTTGSGTGSSSATSQGVTNNSGSNSSSGSFNVGANQVINASTLSFFAEDTTVEGGTVTAVDTATAQEAINQATQLYGNGTYIASIVDINVPGASFPYKLTIKCSNVWKGQTVTVLHKVNGQWERLKPSTIADNSVTVTVNSFSPFAIVVDTHPSPKTGDVALMVSGLAGLFATGAVFTRKKR